MTDSKLSVITRIDKICRYDCIRSWSQASQRTKKNLKTLKILYKKVKVIDKKPWNYHHCAMIKTYHLGIWDNFHNAADLRLVHKLMNPTL